MRNNYVDRLDKLAHLLSQDKHAFFYNPKDKADAIETVKSTAALIKTMMGEASGIVGAIRPPPKCKYERCGYSEMEPMKNTTHAFSCSNCGDIARRDDEGGITYAHDTL